MPYDCFISYASADIRFAEELNNRLMADDFTVWFDKTRLQPGFDWHREIEQGCENSRVFLPVLTPRWKESEWTRFETYGAEAVIPLVFEGEWKDVCTPPLERFQAEKYDATDLTTTWSRLCKSLRRLLDQPLPQKTQRLTHLHYRPNPNFVGRDADLIRIHEELHRNPRASLTQGRVRAIVGSGGYGKTTLVRQYTEKFWRCYPQMLWVDTRLGVEAEYARMHDLLYPEQANIGYKDADKALRALQALHAPDLRLLVLDNVEDEQSISDWIPKTGGCHTLITSRFTSWSASVKTVHLFVLDREPSLLLLQNRAGREASGVELEACRSLADEMGYLPLALEQAAAYVEQQGEGFGFGDYLRLYKQAATELLAAGGLGNPDYPDSVMTTWKATMDRLSSSGGAVLRLGSFMASVPIPVEMLIASAGRVRSLSSDGSASDPSQNPVADELYVRSALTDLRRYSMAQFDGRSIRIHALVQLVARESLPPAERARWWQAAVGVLVGHAGPHGYETQLAEPLKTVMLHAEKLEKNHAALVDTDPSTELAEILRDCYYSQGRYDEAVPFAEIVYAEDRREFGDDNVRYTLRSLNDLGILHLKRSAFAEAEKALRTVVNVAGRVLGDGHYLTLTYTQNLAQSLDKQGKWEEAESLYGRVLDVNPLDIAALGNLAYMKQNGIGDYVQARELYLRALQVDPADAINLNNFAGLCLVLQDFAEAETQLRNAWKTTALRMDRFAARTLFLRSALAALRGEDPGLFLGQIKTIIEAGLSPAPSENVSVMNLLRSKLPPGQYVLYEAVFDGINRRTALSKLQAIPEWQQVPAVAMTVAWPS